ncbi:unnamed protein product [Brassicogethes aeneus]|uniref:THAP-type domain-containing protein n=1 Tax=Brassicogethes aeneus TaxID=1431903 RepID=A0A9P0B9L9_BRAAE|nr:unnamed protein product [Brassicogethes aeneus]
MPRKCCIPNCNSNYASAKNSTEKVYVPVFQFPKDKELCEKWKKLIPRKNFIPTEYSAVCIKHFEPACIPTGYVYKDKSENTKIFNYDRPKLKPGSCPTIFSGQPKKLNKVTAPNRKSPDSRRSEILARKEQLNKQIELTKIEADTIKDYESFKTAVSEKVQNFNNSRKTDLQVQIKQDFILIYFFDFDTMRCKFYIKTDVDLTPKIYVNNIQLCINEIQLILLDSNKVNMWSKLEKILDHLLNKDFMVSVESLVEDIMEKIETIKNKVMLEDNSEEKIIRISILCEQLALIFKEQKRYSPRMMMNSYLIYMQSKKCYEALRSNNILTLPHPKYIQQLTASLNVSPGSSLENHHMKLIGSKLKEEFDSSSN